jgi:hypothetical protein
VTTISGLVCDYCGQPAGSPVARLSPGDPGSRLVGVTHDAAGCYGRFLAEAQALDATAAREVAAVEAGRTTGNCRDCGNVGPGRLVGHIDQGSGPGWTVVVCPRCERNPPKRRASEQPRTYSA